MKHRNLKDERWTRMAIDSLFERGKHKDWKEFAVALRNDRQIALDALCMSEHHAENGSAELARVLVSQFYGTHDLGLE
ncbi:MAG: hypothetical protein ACT4O9_02975 [Blastocatellia bacterium]